MATDSKFEVHYTPYSAGGNDHSFALPHSCGEWEIGTADDMRAFIAECQAALDAVESGNVDSQGIYPPNYWEED